MNQLKIVITLMIILSGGQAFASNDCPINTQKAKVVGPSVGKPMTKAFNALNESRAEDAIEIVLSIETKREHEKAFIAKHLADMYLQVGREVEARKQLSLAIKLARLSGKDHAYALKQYAGLLAKNNQHKEAIAQYKRWIAFTCKDNSVDINVKIAQSFAAIQEWENVINYTQIGLNIEPMNTQLLELKFNAEFMLEATPPKTAKLDRKAKPTTKRDEPRLIVRIQHHFPLNAAKDGVKEGWVQLSYSVNTEGGVENVVVIKQDPSGLFAKQAIKSLKKWKYVPKMVNGKAVITKNLIVQLDFVLPPFYQDN